MVMADKKDPQPPILRRSSRSTRGSIKPVIDLVKDEAGEEDDDQVRAAVPVEKKPQKPATRKSSVKKEPTSTVKRNSVKKSAVKMSANQKEPEADGQPSAGKEGTKLEADDEPQGEERGEPEFCYELSDKEMKEINRAFDLNQFSDAEEVLAGDGLRTAIRSLGFEPRGDEIKRLMKKFSTKPNRITRDGFHKIMAFKFGTTPAMKSDRSNDEISRVFNLLDLDRTGLITLRNLKSIAKELNEELTDEDLFEMIAEADQDGDSKINKDEFHNIMKKTSLY